MPAYLSAEAGQGTDTEEGGRHVARLGEASLARLPSPDEASGEESGGDGVEPRVLGRVTGAAEEIEHALGDQEATEDVCRQLDAKRVSLLRLASRTLAAASHWGKVWGIMPPPIAKRPPTPTRPERALVTAAG